MFHAFASWWPREAFPTLRHVDIGSRHGCVYRWQVALRWWSLRHWQNLWKNVSNPTAGFSSFCERSSPNLAGSVLFCTKRSTMQYKIKTLPAPSDPTISPKIMGLRPILRCYSRTTSVRKLNRDENKGPWVKSSAFLLFTKIHYGLLFILNTIIQH